MTDIRRTVTVGEKITGAELARTFRKVARLNGLEYVEKILWDIDGEKTMVIGVQSPYPGRGVIARTGQDLSNIEIKPEEIYEKVGVGNLLEFTSDDQYLMTSDEEEIVEAVEVVRDGIEKILYSFCSY